LSLAASFSSVYFCLVSSLSNSPLLYKMCDVCGKEFSQSGDKRRHERTHTSFRPYQCFICDKEFNQSGHLQRHLRVHAGHILYNNGEFDKELTRQKYTEEKEAAKDKTKKCH
jgi:uncharacterized Zn-finger protein